MGLAEAVVGIQIAGVEHTALRTAVGQCDEVTAYGHESTFRGGGQRLHDVVGLYVELSPQMAECQRGCQQVAIFYHVDAATLGAYEVASLLVLCDIHRGTTAQAFLAVGLTLMPLESHVFSVILQLGCQQAVASRYQQDVVVGQKQVAGALAIRLRIVAWGIEVGFFCLWCGGIADAATQRGHPEASPAVFRKVVDITMGNVAEMGYFVCFISVGS